MSPEANPGPSQEKMDNIQVSRTLNDAELLRGGAMIKGGVLRPTELQIDAIKDQYDPKSARQVVKSLYTRLEAEAHKPREIFEHESENRRVLDESIQKIVEPYVGLFADHMSRPGKPGLLSKIRSGRRKSEWAITEGAGVDQYQYQFKMTYNQADRYNEINQVQISQNGKDKLQLNYYQGELSQVTCYLGEVIYNRDESVAEILGFVRDHFYTDKNYFSIKFDLDNPAITVNRISNEDQEYNLQVIYGFSALENSFICPGSAKVSSDRMSTPRFLELLGEALDVIPTVDKEY